MKKSDYFRGFRRGIPVSMGYFSVSFGFGTMAAALGIRALDAALISLTNLTSAGQFAGLTLIAAGTTVWEIVLTQIIINSRYALMSMALSQRLGEKTGLAARLAISFINTDEIFALAMAEKTPINTPFLLGLGTAPVAFWTLGTLSGALAGSVLPENIRTALSVMLYGMFVAILVPPAKRERPVLVAVGVATVLSCCFSWIPGLRQVSGGVVIVLCTLVGAGLCAWLFPVEEETA